MTTRSLRVELSPSHAFAAAIAALHLAAAACALLVMPEAIGFALGALLLALGAASAWQRALLRGARSQRAIEILPSGEARVILANAESMRVEPVTGMGVNRYWVALKVGTAVSPAGGPAWRRSVLVTGDMAEGGKFRQLRLWALWGRVPGVAPGQLGR